MKKLLIYFLLAVSGQAAIAQQDCSVPYTNFTISPASFTAEDEITITMNFTSTNLAGETELYIWAWCNKDEKNYPPEDGITNTDWNNSPEMAKMTPVPGSPNTFTYTLTGTVLFNLSPGQLKHFQFLGKTRSGSKQSCDSKSNAFDPLVFIPSMLRVFPAKVGQNDVVSLYFHQDLATTVDEQRMVPASVTVEVFDNTGASAGQPLTLPVRNVGTKLWKAYFVPTRSYTPGAGKKFVRFTYTFNGTVRDDKNAPVAVSTPVTEVPLTDMK